MDAPAYDPSKGYGPFDRILLSGAAAERSWNEISALTNGVISPLAAEARVNEILSARSPLDEAQKQLLLTDEIMRLKDSLMEKAIEWKSLEHVDRLMKVFTLIDKRLAGTKFDLEKAMNEITRAQGQLMLQGISLALERSFLELEKRYPEVRKAELLEIFHTAMPDVVREIESHVAV